MTPDTYVVERSTVELVDRRIGDKTVMTVRADEGTREEAVPGHRRRMAVLDADRVADLAALGARIERLEGAAADVEWVIHDGQVAIVQARPVTGEFRSEEWNDSCDGNYLWTCSNVGEAVPSLMTPCTWSLVQIFMDEAMSLSAIGRHRLSGNIGGRFYVNLSVVMAVGTAFGLGEPLRRTSEQAFGHLPAELEIPRLPISRWQVIRRVAHSVVSFLRRVLPSVRRLPALVAETPAAL